MADETSISWTNRTWNPWRGCTKVSPGCKNCYMFRDQTRYGKDPSVVVRTKTWNDPLRWQREAEKSDRQELIFTCSWSDWFHKDADEWRTEAWEIVRRCPNLVFQILTKRPDRIKENLPADWCAGYPNVWLGVSIESNRYVDRAEIMKSVPAVVHFVSAEPLLSSVPGLDLNGVDWVIAGGESGPGVRPSEPDWFRFLRDKCEAAGVPFHFKQWGEWIPYEHCGSPPLIESQHGDNVDSHCLPEGLTEHKPVSGWYWPDGLSSTVYRHVGKKKAGRLLDGVIHDAFPVTERVHP